MFPETPLNKVRRKPQRGHYDRDTIYPILDEALICHLGIVDNGQPYVIPTIHARHEDTLYLHGAPASRMLKYLQSGNPVCVTVTLIDGLVFARSTFDHSMNYRSVMAFGHGRLVEDDAEKWKALEVLTEHIARGRWDQARQPSPKEMAATLVVAVDIESASAKIRTGPPIDEEEDYALENWAGILPILSQHPGTPIPDPKLKAGIPVPDNISHYQRGE